MKRILAVFAAATLATGAWAADKTPVQGKAKVIKAAHTPAFADENGPLLKSSGVLVLDAATGNTLYAKNEKEVDSRSGMTRSAQASPDYPAWVATHPADLAIARDAIRRRDFAALAEVAEHNCLKMHAAAIAARPPLLYWNAATLQCLTEIQRLRREGLPVFFTIDAGPQVKAICEPRARADVERALRPVPGVLQVLGSSLGPGAEQLN